MAPVRTVIADDLLTEPAIREEASEVIEHAHDRRIRGLAVTLDDGTTVDLPPHLAQFLSHIVQSAASGATISVMSMPEELTTTTAARELGVSRPTLMKMVAAGELPATKVRSHTRLRRDDVLKLRAIRQAGRQAAATAVLRAGEAFD